MRRVLAGIVLAAVALHARAAGYAIQDQGARAMGQGQAAVATVDALESLFLNPAGWSGRGGWELSAGATLLHLDVESTATTGAQASSARDHFEVPHVLVGWSPKAPAQPPRGRWSFGASVNAPFGLATEWPKDFEGRFVSRVADLKTLQVAALCSLTKGRWTFALGPTWTHGDVQLVRDVDLSVFRRGHSAEADLTGAGATLGWRGGVRWRGAEGWRFGASWHGEAKLKLSGDVDYTVVPLGALSLDEAIATLFVDGPASTELTLPGTGWVGFGHAGRKLSWELAATWTNWSVMDEVIVDLAPIEAGGTQLVINEFLTPSWHDAAAVRLGARWDLPGPWSACAGLAHDDSPVPARTADPLLPDSDRLVASVGAGRWGARFDLDVAVQAVRFDRLDTKGSGNELEMEYESLALALGVTGSWRFGK